MNPARYRLALGLLFFGTAKVFDMLIVRRPAGEYWDMAYYCSAASVDWMMYRLTPRFVRGKLCRDVQALTTASMVVNALGFALYMAYAPPYIYNWIIRGINYVLAIRLTFSGNGHDLNYNHWRYVVRSAFIRRADRLEKKAQR